MNTSPAQFDAFDPSSITAVLNCFYASLEKNNPLSELFRVSLKSI